VPLAWPMAALVYRRQVFLIAVASVRRRRKRNFKAMLDEMRFFDCWWALFGNRAAENNDEGHSVC
jgi:hypothetical protein